MPNRFLSKFVSSDPPRPVAPQTAAEVNAPTSDKLLITTESVGTNASEVSRALISSNARQDSRELLATGTTAKQCDLGPMSDRAFSGGRFARLRSLLPSSKTSARVSGAPLPAPLSGPGPAPASGSGRRYSGAGATRSVGSGGAISGSGGVQAEKERSCDGIDSGAGSGKLPRQQKSSSIAHDKTGRWWAASLAPSRLREGEQMYPGVMLDTVGSGNQPPDMVTSADVGASTGAQPQTRPAAQLPSATQVQQQAGPNQGDGSGGSSGQTDSYRFNRFRKSSGRHLRASLERNLQNKATTRNGSGPGGVVSGGAGSTIESKPRDSFESDWDVMGAENDGNALSTVGAAMSTTMAFDGNSGGANGGGGSRGTSAFMAAVAAAMANASSGGGGGGGGTGASGSETANSDRQQSKIRKGPTGMPTRTSRDLKENLEPGDGQQQQQPRQLPQQQLSQAQQQADSDGANGRDRPQRGILRSPTSSSNMPVDLSFNPNLHHLTLQRAGLAVGVMAQPKRLGAAGPGISSGGRPVLASDRAGTEVDGEGSSCNGRPSTPEDLLAAQMMALQNRINALTDEDLLNPSSTLTFVSPSPFLSTSPSQAVPPPPLTQSQPTLQQLAATGAGASLPYQLPSSGSEAGLGFVGALRAGSSANLGSGLPHHHYSFPHFQQPLLQQHAQHQLQSYAQPLHQQHLNYSLQQHPTTGQLGLQPQHGPGSFGMPHLSGMGALDALSAFLGSPPSRAASLYDGGGGIMMTTGAGTAGVATRGSAGSPGPRAGSSARSAGVGAGSSARSGGGNGAGAGMRSMQSINEDGFMGAVVNQAGGSSYPLASSHLAGTGGPTSNSSFLSMRAMGPSSDDPGGMLFTRDDTGMLGPSSRGHMMLARDEAEMMQPPAAPQEHAKNFGGQANMIFFTRGSSLGDRHNILGAGPTPGAPSGGGGRAAAFGGTPAAAAATATTTAFRPAIGDAIGHGVASATGDSPAARSPLPPITTPPAGAGGAGGGRFTLAAALSRVQEELQKSIVAPTPGAAGAPPPTTASASRQLPTATSGSRSTAGSGATSADGRSTAAAASGGGGGWAYSYAGPSAAALTAAAALGRVAAGGSGLVRELGSSNGAGPPGGVSRVSSRRGAFASPSSLPHASHLHQQHYYSANPSPGVNSNNNNNLLPDSPDVIMQQLLNSNTTGTQHQFPGGGGQVSPPSQGRILSYPCPQPPHQSQLNQQQTFTGPPPAMLVAGAAAAGIRGPQTSGDVPTGFRRHSTEFLYDEFFSNGPLQYDIIAQATGEPSSGQGTLPSSSSPLETTDAMLVASAGAAIASTAAAAGAYGRGVAPAAPGHFLLPHGSAGAQAAAAAGGTAGVGTALGPGPPPVQSRNVRRNVSAESLRIRAAHRSMEGRAAAAAGGGTAGVGPLGALQWGGPAPLSPLSSSGGTPTSPPAAHQQQQQQQQQRLTNRSGSVLPASPPWHPQQSVQQQQAQNQTSRYQSHNVSPNEGLFEPAYGQTTTDAAGGGVGMTGAAAAGSVTAAGPGSVVPAASGTSRTARSHNNGSGSSNGATGSEMQPPQTAMSPPLSLGSGVAGAGSGLFLDNSTIIRYPLESVRAATNSPDLFSSGGFAGAGLSSTDAVVAGLMESVLRSGAASTLQEDTIAISGGGASAYTGAGDNGGASAAAPAVALAASVAHNLAILGPNPGRYVSLGIGGSGAAAGRGVSGTVGGIAKQPAPRGRPASFGGTLTSSGGTALQGIGTSSNSSLEALMSFRDESGQPLVQIITPTDIARLEKQQQQQQQQQLLREAREQQQQQLQQQPRRAAGSRPATAAIAGPDVSVMPRPLYGTCELMLLGAGVLVVLFNLVVVVYVLVSVHLMELCSGGSDCIAGRRHVRGGGEL